MQTSKITPLKEPLTDFNGLNEKEIIEMSRRATIKKLQAGDMLMKEDEADPMVYVVLHGKMNLVENLNAHPKTIAVFLKGDWIEGTVPSGGPPSPVCLVAAEPARIMAMDKTTIDTLNDTTQLAIYKRLAYLYAERISKVQKNENRLLEKNRQLKQDIFNYRSLLKTGFHRSEMIKDIIQKVPRLPDVLWKSIEYQAYPEFCSPRAIPEDLRYNVTLLYLSHLRYNLFQGKKERELPTTFLDEYVELTNWNGLTLEDVARNRLLPAMVKKSQTYPLPLRQLIEKQK